MEDLVRTWKNIKENIKTSAKESLALYEMKQHKVRFDKECSRFLDEKEKDKMQWVQNPTQSYEYNLNIARRETSRHFRNIKKE
jgi:hypothetical protein